MAIYVVLRIYHESKRPLCWTDDREKAEAVYAKAEKELRDGDVALFEIGVFQQLKMRSGGYNRTKW